MIRFIEAGRSLDKLCEGTLPSCIYRRPDEEPVRGQQQQRNRDVNDIPSPWLTGVMDKFFDGRMTPLIETNRGCPFRCSFCVQGTEFYNRVANFDLDRLRQEIDYVGRMIRERSPQMGALRIADANYGMYERDVEISGYIGEAQKKYGWPSYIDATTGKNRPERIIRSMEEVNGALVLYQAVQSLDDEVLRNIRRSNINLKAYEQMRTHVRGRGMRSASDLILGLPGESMQSHLEALHKLIDAGTDQAHCFQAMMLKGADMESTETRSRFKFETRFRVVSKNFGIYDGEKVFDIEEIVVATDTLPFQDYVQCRKHHLTFSVFWNDSWFSDVVGLAGQVGIKPSEWLSAALGAMEADTGQVRQMLEEFENETVCELFPSRQACTEFYAREENFRRLRCGEIGDNLMYKYRARASFFMWPEVCACAMDMTRRLLLERGAAQKVGHFGAFWRELHRYVEARHAAGGTVEEITAPVEVLLGYDIGRWLADGGRLETADEYRLAAPRKFVFRLSEEGERELIAALKVWSTRLTGLTKFVTRVRIASQVRQCRPAAQDAASSLSETA